MDINERAWAREMEHPPLTAPLVTVTETITAASAIIFPAPSLTAEQHELTRNVTLTVPVEATPSYPTPAHPSPIPVSILIFSVPSTSPAPLASPVPTQQGESKGLIEGHSGGMLHPNKEQFQTIWIGVVMFFSILVGWNVCLIKDILYPWKMWVNFLHESCHVLMGILTGAKILSVSIDPDNGPLSEISGGHTYLILASGYLGSSSIGAALLMAAFDTSASKIAALLVYPALIFCFWFGRTWARMRILVCVGLSIGFWFIDHAAKLRYYILFLGIMNSFYVVLDVLDDQLYGKTNRSDAILFAQLGALTSHAWALLWILIALIITSLGIIAGLHFFHKDPRAQQMAQTHFLPT